MDWRGIPSEFRNQIVTGDARVLSDRIPDESIDLIFTDPVYDRIDDYRWLAQTAARVLKPGGDLVVYAWNEFIPNVIKVSMRFLNYRGIISHYHPGRVKPTFTPMGYNKWTPLIWFSRDQEKRLHWRDAFQTVPVPVRNRQNGHQWAKLPAEAKTLLLGGFPEAEIILDTYCGGGTVPAVCKMLSRNYVAFEIDPPTAERARERVRDTQPPLFVLQPEQAVMAL